MTAFPKQYVDLAAAWAVTHHGLFCRPGLLLQRFAANVGRMRTDVLYALAKGSVTYVPWLYHALARNREGNTASAAYCYGVWFKHFTLLREIGYGRVPSVIIELGPGGSIGTGVAAIYSGASQYIGVDANALSNPARNRAVALELASLFRRRVPIAVKGWPDFSRHLDSSGRPPAAPAEPDADDALARALYKAPWTSEGVVEANSADLVFSHSVLEHVFDLPAAMRAAYRWLKPGGLMSHQFDLQSHGVTRAWDGHRAMGDRLWRAAVGRRPIPINRLPYSAILRAIEEAGFEILNERRCIAEPTLSRDALRPDWAACSDEDLRTMGGFVQARKS
jgi:SAM-dependent methyltransferase